MPARSKSQQRKLFALDPNLGKEFAVKGKAYDKLPEHVKKTSKTKKKKR